MKKARDFVTKGVPEETFSQDANVFEHRAPLSAHSHPADLPRDHGMAGEVGAYEVKPVAHFVQQAMNALAKSSETAQTDDPVAIVRALLKQILPPAEQHRLAVERVSSEAVVLSLAQHRDRFLYSRTVVPKLQAALRPMWGGVRIQLVDRC